MPCSCIPPPASLQPRKVYNILVPDVFPLQPPDPSHDVPKSVERKVEKLAEYLQKHPARTAKVSRRLTRRIKRELGSRKYGYVMVAVHTYRVLLSKTAEEDSKFTFSYFAKELIDEPDAVVRTLLIHPEPLVKRLGAELLASYIAAQNPVEHQLQPVQALVSIVCELACHNGGQDPQLKLACLCAVSAFLGLCHALKSLPFNLDEIERTVLRNLDVSGDAGASSGSPDESTIPGLAHSVLLQFKPFLQDTSTVYRVMETIFRHLDQEGRWQQTDAVQRLMAIVQTSCLDQPFPLFAALMRHSSTAGLGPDERAVVINLALLQPPVYSLSAFSLALQELPRALTADHNSDHSHLRNTVRAAMRKLAMDVGDAVQLCEAISSVLRQHAKPSKQAQACLECALDAANVIPSFPEVGRTFPDGHAPAQLLQQLAAIITVWSPAEVESRALACELLRAVLPACGPGLRDEKQALGLMDLVLQMAGNVSLGTPADVATMSCVLSTCLSSRQPELLLHGVRLCKALLAEVLKYIPPAGAAVAVERVAITAGSAERQGTGDDEADRLWAVALLKLTNNLLTMLATRANCNHLLALRFGISADECTSLKEENGILVSCSPLFQGSTVSAESCLRAVQTDWPLDHWYGKVLDALCKGSNLQTAYMHNLQNVIFEPFAAHAMPGLPSTQQLAVLPSLPSGDDSLSKAADSAGAGGGAGPSGNGRDKALKHISSKLEAMARSRVASIKRERLNLQHVLDLLADGDTDDVVEQSDSTCHAEAAPEAPATSNVVVSPENSPLTVAEVLTVISAYGLSTASALPSPPPLEFSDLLQRLEAVTG